MDILTLKPILINLCIFIIGAIIGRITMAVEYAIVTKATGAAGDLGKTQIKLPSDPYVPKLHKPKPPRVSSPGRKNRLW